MLVPAFAASLSVVAGLPLGAAAPPPAPIVGGEEVPLSEWTSVVAILGQDTVSTASLCTGTLVAPRVVLTAAHCLEGPRALEDMRVIFGDSIYTHDDSRVADVAAYAMYPDACTDDCDADAYDFGYVILAQDVSGVEIIPPLVEQEDWDATMQVGGEIFVVGFGTTVDPDDDKLLTTADVGHKRIMSTPIDSFTRSGREFRAGGEGRDACGGDSGGPAFVQLPTGEYRLAGVTSRGVRPCGTGDSVYGVPYPILDWLREETGADLLPASCPDGGCLQMALPDEGCDCSASDPRGALGLLALLLLARRRRHAARA